jgi:hypothetical protein
VIVGGAVVEVMDEGSVFVTTGALSAFELDSGTDGGVVVGEKGASINPAADKATTPATTAVIKPPIAVTQPGIVFQNDPSFLLSLLIENSLWHLVFQLRQRQ